MIVVKIPYAKFYCGFCGTIKECEVKQSTGNGKSATVSNVIKCEKCGANIPQSNQLNPIGGQNGNKK